MQPQAVQHTEAGRTPAATFADSPPRRLFTLPKFAERHSGHTTLPAITNLVFKSKSRQSTKGEIPGNGLVECGAVVRVNGRVLIDEDAYFRWVDAQQSGSRN